MKVIQSAAEIEKIQGVLVNFGWKLVKQEITAQELTLTINRPALSLTDERDQKPD